MANQPLIRNVSDTARWVAMFRARESERPDAVFRDPFARRLAGERGEQIAEAVTFAKKASWSFVTRTYLFDRFIAGEVQQGAETVINLAAGLDSRPYRMALPASLRWIEVDLPEILTYKEDILKDEKPVCSLERFRLDLSDVPMRRELFQQLAAKARRALIITEGLLTYLTEEEVGAFARDLGVNPSFQRWALDLPSPALLRMLQKNMGAFLQQAPLKFGPAEGPAFFAKFGWESIEIQSMLQNAAKLKRLSLLFRLMAMMPDDKGTKPSRPWSGVCLFQNQAAC